MYFFIYRAKNRHKKKHMDFCIWRSCGFFVVELYTSLQRFLSCRHFGTRHKGDSFNNGHRKDYTLGKVPLKVVRSHSMGFFFPHWRCIAGFFSEDFIVCLYTQRPLFPDNDLLSISLRLPFKGYIRDLLSIYDGYAGQDSHW